jgi:hypothetical protein
MSARAFLRSDAGASAAEFALVLPLLLLFLLCIIDAGRFMWEYNQAEKATQMGVRYAVATNLVAPGLASYSFASGGGVPQGTPIPTSAGAGTGWFANAACSNSTCSCSGSSGICSVIGYDSAAFANIVERMKIMYPPINGNNVTIEYRNVGLGFAGDPNGPDVAPLVTVRLTGMTFQPLTTMMFGANFGMPDFRAALTLEDGSNNGLADPRAN